MKSNCNVEGNIECFLEDGTPCGEYNGPRLITSIEAPGCPAITCIDETRESCRQDVRYTFTLRNKDRPQRSVVFDVKHPKISNSMVAWKIVEPNKVHFEPLQALTGDRKFRFYQRH